MRPKAFLTACALTVVLLTVSSSVRAQAAPEVSEASRQEASERFRRGVELFQEGAFRAALVEFERAYEIAPDYRLHYNIGQVQLQLGDYLSATHRYESYLAEGGAEVPPARREDVKKALKILNERVGRVAITSNVAGAEIFVDDLKVGVTPLPASVVVNVGRHRVYARSDDGAVATQVIDIAGGDSRGVHLKLKTAETAPTARKKERAPLTRTRKLAIASWAVGGAALAGAVITGLVAQGKVDDRKAELKRDVPDQKKLGDLEDSGSSLALTADALGALALVGIGTGVVLWVMGGRAQARQRDQAAGGGLAWQVGLGHISAQGSF